MPYCHANPVLTLRYPAFSNRSQYLQPDAEKPFILVDFVEKIDRFLAQRCTRTSALSRQQSNQQAKHLS
jgi:hypothetical protein